MSLENMSIAEKCALATKQAAPLAGFPARKLVQGVQGAARKMRNVKAPKALPATPAISKELAERMSGTPRMESMNSRAARPDISGPPQRPPVDAAPYNPAVHGADDALEHLNVDVDDAPTIMNKVAPRRIPTLLAAGAAGLGAAGLGTAGYMASRDQPAPAPVADPSALEKMSIAEKCAFITGASLGALGGLATGSPGDRGHAAGRGAVIGGATELGMWPGALAGGVGGSMLGQYLSTSPVDRFRGGARGGAYGAIAGALLGGALGNVAGRGLVTGSTRKNKEKDKEEDKEEAGKEAGLLSTVGRGALGVARGVVDDVGKIPAVLREYAGNLSGSRVHQLKNYRRDISAATGDDIYEKVMDAFIKKRDLTRGLTGLGAAGAGGTAYAMNKKSDLQQAAGKEAGFFGAAGRAIGSGVSRAVNAVAPVANKAINAVGTAAAQHPTAASFAIAAPVAAAGVAGVNHLNNQRMDAAVDRQRARVAPQPGALAPAPAPLMAKQAMPSAWEASQFIPGLGAIPAFLDDAAHTRAVDIRQSQRRQPAQTAPQANVPGQRTQPSIPANLINQQPQKQPLMILGGAGQQMPQMPQSRPSPLPAGTGRGGLMGGGMGDNPLAMSAAAKTAQLLEFGYAIGNIGIK